MALKLRQINNTMINVLIKRFIEKNIYKIANYNTLQQLNRKDINDKHLKGTQLDQVEGEKWEKGGTQATQWETLAGKEMIGIDRLSDSTVLTAPVPAPMPRRQDRQRDKWQKKIHTEHTKWFVQETRQHLSKGHRPLARPRRLCQTNRAKWYD